MAYLFENKLEIDPPAASVQTENSIRLRQLMNAVIAYFEPLTEGQ